jgi:MFS family permease
LRAIVRGNVLWLGVASLLNDAASDMIFPLLPVFIVSVLGASPAWLGIIEGVAEATSSLAKLGGGWLSDRSGRRKGLAVVGYLLPVVARPFIALTTAAWQIAGVRFVDRIGKGIRTAPRDALLAESVPVANRGAAFGFHRAADHAGAVVGPLIATAFLMWRPGDYRTLFALSAVPGVVLMVVLLTRVRDMEPSASGRPAPAQVAAAVTGGVELGGMFRRFLAVVALFTLGNATDAFLLLRAETLGVDAALLPLLWSVFHVSKVAWSVPGGALSDRAGPRRAIAGGWLVYAVVYAGFALATEAWQAWLLFVVYGLFYGLTEAPEKALVANLAPPDRRGLAFGAFHLVVGVAVLPASLLFGLLWNEYGAPVAFFTGAGLALAAAAALPFAIPAGQGRAVT